MRRRYSHSIISFLVIIVVGLGASLTGASVCPPGCSDCGVVPVCCTAMDDNLASGAGETAGHWPGRSGCSHEGICLNDIQLIDASADRSAFEYDVTLVLYHLSTDAHPDNICKTLVSAGFLKSAIENFPPLYLRICSFLI